MTNYWSRSTFLEKSSKKVNEWNSKKKTKMFILQMQCKSNSILVLSLDAIFAIGNRIFFFCNQVLILNMLVLFSNTISDWFLKSLILFSHDVTSSQLKQMTQCFETVMLHKARLVYLHSSCPLCQIICMHPISTPWERYGPYFNSRVLYPDTWVLTR